MSELRRDRYGLYYYTWTFSDPEIPRSETIYDFSPEAPIEESEETEEQ